MSEQEPWYQFIKPQEYTQNFLCRQHGGFVYFDTEQKKFFCNDGGEEICYAEEIILLFGKVHPPL